MYTSTKLKMIHVQGTPNEIGQQIGDACREEIRRMLEIYRKGFEIAYDELQLTWDEAVLQGRKYYPFTEEFTPQYVAELEGMAETSGVDFEDLMVLNSMEAITSDALHLGCTSLAISAERTSDGHVLVGHNEDWLPEDEENTYLIHAKPDQEPAFLAITYGGLLPNIGFNEHGIAHCCDSVYPDDVRIGVPRIFVSRAVLAAPRIAEAIRRALLKKRAAGYNHLIADRNGEIYNVEVSARRFAAIYGTDGYLAHTNHYLAARMRQVEDHTEDLIGSRVRVNRALRLLRGSDVHTPDSLKSILSDHVNYPSSICSHVEPEDNPLDRQKTIASLIMDMTALEMHVCWGNPCEGEYHTYRLEVQHNGR
jgi:isopenicillin-N N-acyltransferase-like protein